MNIRPTIISATIVLIFIAIVAFYFRKQVVASIYGEGMNEEGVNEEGQKYSQVIYKDAMMNTFEDAVEYSSDNSGIDVCAEHCKNDPLCDIALYDNATGICMGTKMKAAAGDTILSGDYFIPGKRSQLLDISGQTFMTSDITECNRLRKTYGVNNTMAYYKDGECKITTAKKKVNGMDSIFILKDK